MRLKWSTRITSIYEEVQSCTTLAIPFSLAQLLEASIFLVDTWSMGQLGSKTLAAGALSSIIFQFLYSIGIFTISAVNTLAAIAFGQKQLQKLDSIVIQGWYLSLVFSLPMMLILSATSLWITVFPREETVLALAVLYLKTVLWGLPALFGYEVLRNVLIAINQPKVITNIAIFGVFLNLGANYLLAFGKLGFPSLGLVGIGWSTVIVLWVQLLIASSFIYFNPNFKDYQFFKKGFQIHISIFSEIFQLGWPIGLQYVLIGSYQIVLLYFISYFGKTSLAAFQIADRVGSLVRYIVFGLAQATVARVGQMYGQKMYKQKSLEGVRQAGFVGISLAICITLIATILINSENTHIIHIFLIPKNEVDLEVFQLTRTFLIILALHQVINGIDTTATAALRGIKDTKSPMLLGTISCWGISMGSAYLLGFYWHFQVVGLLVSNCFGSLVSALILPVCFYLKTSMRSKGEIEVEETMVSRELK